MEGRAAHQRHHGRRGPAAAPVPRHPAAGRARAGRALDPLAAARRRHLGQLRGRPGRSVDDGRGVRGAAPGRRRPRRSRTCVAAREFDPRARRHRGHAECSPGSGSRCSASGRGTTCRRCRRRSCCCPVGCRSTSTTGRCWARQTVVPITVVATLRPVPPAAVHGRRAAYRRAAGRASPSASAQRGRARFSCSTRALKRYERSPVKPGRSAVLHRAAEWIIARQEADGGWGGIQPPWVYSILALHLLGYPLDHPVLAAAIDGLEGFLVREQTAGRRRAAPRGVPVAGLGHLPGASSRLLDAGVPADDPALRRAADWLLGEEIRVRGDWSVRRPDLAPGGWAFEFANDGYPDVDDTAEVVLALDRLDADRARRADAIERGVAWVVGMQSARRRLGRVRRRQHPAADREAAVLRLRRGHRPAVGRRHRARRRDARRPRASPTNRRGAGAACAGCSTRRSPTARGSAGGARTTSTAPAPPCPRWSPPASPPDSAPIRRAVRWLEQHQNDDGGWGEDLRSYATHAWRGRGASTAVADGVGAARPARRRPDERDAVERGISWLVDTQRDDGGWDEDALHRHRLPRRLLHQLRDVPARVPAQRSRPLRSPARRWCTAMTGLLVVHRAAHASTRRWPGRCPARGSSGAAWA